MTKLKKISLWIIVCFVFLVGILSAIILFSGNFINQEPILKKIQAKASQIVGGKVAFQQLDLSFFPHLQIKLHQCSFSLPPTATGKLASLTFYPKFLSLFTGELRGTRIHVNAPDIKIRLRKRPEPKERDLKSLSFETVEEKVGSALSFISSKASGLVILVEKGRLNFYEEKKAGFWFKDIDASINLPTDKINLDIQCTSSLWEDISLQGTIHLDEDKSSFAIDNLKFDHPRLIISGKLDIDHSPQPASPKVSLELKSSDVDIHSIRKVALALAGETPVVRNVFEIVKGGKLPYITLTTRGNSLKDLGELENIDVTGAMLDGKLFIPVLDSNLKNVKGDVTISKGILQGKNLAARLGNSLGQEGTFQMGLMGENAPFHLDMALEADLAQLPPIMKRLVENKYFQKELALIEDLQGNATGRLYLGDRIKSIKAMVEVSQFNLTANYRRMPHLLKINGGQYTFKWPASAVKNLSGSMGKSTFTALSAKTDWGKVPKLEIESGMATIFLDEIYPWLMSSVIIFGKLQNLQAVKGVLELSALSLHGPLLASEKYHYQIIGQVRNLAVNSSLLPGTIEVSTGSFKLNPEHITIADFQTKILDGSLSISGAINGGLKGFDNLDMTFGGEMGSRATNWVSGLVNLPSQLNLRPPVSISDAHLTWNNRQETAFSGNLALQQGLKTSIDILVNSNQLTIKKLIIQDKESHASFKITSNNRVFDLYFSGNLNKTTIDHLMAENQILGGWVKGDFHAHMFLAQPLNSTFKGKLRARDIIPPWKNRATLAINNLSLEAKEDNVRIESANLSWADNRFDLQGNVSFSADGLLLDMKLSADDLKLDNLKQTLDAIDKENHEKAGASLLTYPVRGILKVKTENLTYQKFTWSPFYADVSLGDGTVEVAITEANLCGIDTAGIVRISPQELQVDVKPLAQNQNLHSAIYCLLDKSVAVDGNFNLKGSITALGTRESLLRSLNGNLDLAATKGRFYSGRFYNTLTKIFALLDVSQIFKGKLPDIAAKGFGYNSFQAKANIQNDKLTLNKMIIDGTSMEIVSQGSIDLINKQIDVLALVAPFKTVDLLVKKIPVVKDIIGGSLISVPFRITGNLENPKVTPLSPSAVGSGLLGIMKRTLQLPVQIIQPVSFGEEKN